MSRLIKFVNEDETVIEEIKKLSAAYLAAIAFGNDSQTIDIDYEEVKEETKLLK